MTIEIYKIVQSKLMVFVFTTIFKVCLKQGCCTVKQYFAISSLKLDTNGPKAEKKCKKRTLIKSDKVSVWVQLLLNMISHNLNLRQNGKDYAILAKLLIIS